MASVLFEPIYLAGRFFNSRKEVKDGFPGYETLVEKYFKKDWRRGGPDSLEVPNKKDRAALIKMLDAQIDTMKAPNSYGKSIYTTGTIWNSQSQKAVQELEAVKRALQSYGKKPSGAVVTNAQQMAELKEIASISEERPYEILFEHAWNLLHPANIDDDVRQAWLKLLRHSRDNPLDILLSHVKEAQDGKPALNYLKNTNIIRPIKKEGATLESAAAETQKEFKQSAAKIKKQADLQKRLHQVFDVLKVMSVINATKEKEINAVINTDDDDSLDKVIQSVPAAIAAQMNISLKPVFAYYETTYKEPYDSINEFVEAQYSKLPIDSIIKIMDAAKKFRLENPNVMEGLVKMNLKDTDKKVQEFLNMYRGYMVKKPAILNTFEPEAEPVNTDLARFTALSSGIRMTDKTVMQYVVGITVNKDTVQTAIETLISAGKAGGVKSSDKEGIIQSIMNYFESDAVYIVIQPIPESGKLKEVSALKANLYFAEKESNKNIKSYTDLYNSSATATQPIMSAFNAPELLDKTPLNPLVQSVSYRLLTLMSTLYFKKVLEDAVEKSAKEKAKEVK
jgi:acetolactate synthase small subunit